MPAPTDSPSPAAAAWTPATLLYLLVLLAGLAVGLWPRWLYIPLEASAGPLPTLHVLAVAQALWLVLMWPLVLMRSGRSGVSFVLAALAALAVQLVVAAPFYVAAAWLSDATWLDVLRLIIFLLCLAPLAIAAAALMAKNATAAAWTLLALMLLSLGLPALYYLGLEFWTYGGGSVEWLWNLGPLTAAWSVATARGTSILPHPLWSPGVLLTMGAIAATLTLLRPR
ncbi:MAG: hypothetical protein ABFD92_15020 [Planctomycetaceae bacterium]|nr:hypothetical protein [Planctomycetaceae bacterium]